MTLKIFNRLTSPNRSGLRSKEPTISLNFSSNTFLFNSRAAVALKLNSDSQVQFAQDDENPGAWYLSILTNNGFKGRLTKSGYRLSNTAISQAVKESFPVNVNDKGIRFSISEKTIKTGGVSWYSLTPHSAL
ncbi:MAG TPA: hypothetical protein PK339_12595 [Flavitalea sp.]|nr:hypothetical protein [Flavitalea sp.]